MFAEDSKRTKRGGKETERERRQKDGGEDDRRWRDERILEITPPWDMRSIKRWQKMACGRDRMRARERAAEEKEEWRDGEY